ncbi:MAG: ribosome silencing factor [Clostridiales Family XIII bacterium]|jgi:ribosome-associated protein|nr:ribosome silencing factor [Clostridiales Family XIII bacterium]
MRSELNNGEAAKGQALAAAKGIATRISDKKGRDIVIIDISGKSSFADYFVNATAGNIRMLDTLETEISGSAGEFGLPEGRTEGKTGSGWILLDFGDVIVNLFLEEQRNLYKLERIWGDCEFIEVEENAREI